MAATLLLCLGVFLAWFPAEQETPVTLAKTGSAHVDRGATGPEHLIGASHLAATLEEAEQSAKGPANASLLTALLLMASFAVAAGWLLTFGRGLGVFGSWRVALHPHFLTARIDTPFLTVFRL